MKEEKEKLIKILRDREVKPKQKESAIVDFLCEAIKAHGSVALKKEMGIEIKTEGKSCFGRELYMSQCIQVRIWEEYFHYYRNTYNQELHERLKRVLDSDEVKRKDTEYTWRDDTNGAWYHDKMERVAMLLSEDQKFVEFKADC